jgi:DnaJ family protein C protein 28
MKPKKPDADDPTRPDVNAARPQDKRRAREMGVDASIRDAMARGDFDNLPGKGKPLSWQTERDDEWWLANHMLQSAGYRPAFIERDEAIRAEKEALAKLLADHRAWHRVQVGTEPPAALAQAAEPVIARYRERATKLNREIDSHNLSVPVPSMQRTRLRIDAELDAFRAALGLT